MSNGEGGWVRDHGFRWVDHFYRPRPPLVICSDCLGCGKVLINREVRTCENCGGEGLTREKGK